MAFSIGFSNFRQFKKFPAIPFGDITILVGANNAGKSTLVKALLLIGDFFFRGDSVTNWHNSQIHAKAEDTHTDIYMSTTEGETPRFYFDRLASARIGTFHRALCNRANSNIITFEYANSKVKYEMDIEEDAHNEQVTNAPISRVRLLDLEHNVKYTCDYKNRRITVVFNRTPLKEYENDKLKEYFDSVPADAIIRVPITFNALFRGSTFKAVSEYLEARIDATIGEGRDYLAESTRKLITIPDLSEEFVKFLKSQKKVYDPSRISRQALDLYMGVGSDSIDYIYAHGINQNIVYSTKDLSNDFVAKTIHEFAAPQVQANDAAKKFVKDWLRFFDIGYDYELISVGGEAHVVNIKAENGTFTNMSDKGMGAIQLIILIFRIATINSSKLVNNEGKLIIIEEPELNLHPSYQSKLADFFYEMNKEYHFRFLIETHSEYLIRKTQVLVKENHLAEEGKKNPFKVYYFGGDNADGKPYYQMRYRPDGIFENEFGKGFFDEAANLAIKIL